MTSDPQRGNSDPDHVSSNADQLVDGIVDVMMTAIGVGASFAKIAAQATAGHRPIPDPPQTDNPLNIMVHYGAVTAVNFTEAVLTSIKEVRATNLGQSVRPNSNTGSTPTEMSSIPTVHTGSSLRIPLSIENPTAELMDNMQFVCHAIHSISQLEGILLTPEAVRIVPSKLSIEPKDFEKLTVFIDVADDITPGEYEVTIGLQDHTFETTFPFLVKQA